MCGAPTTRVRLQRAEENRNQFECDAGDEAASAFHDYMPQMTLVNAKCPREMN